MLFLMFVECSLIAAYPGSPARPGPAYPGSAPGLRPGLPWQRTVLRTYHSAPLMAALEPVEERELTLQVSSPALLLNHMAERYSSTSRILMEFVDNSFDDAEALFDAGAQAYIRPVSIDVFVSRQRRTLRIVDNCRGMPPEVLARVVMRVGESRKRGASFVNGQFGFGMQARYCPETLTLTLTLQPQS